MRFARFCLNTRNTGEITIFESLNSYLSGSKIEKMCGRRVDDFLKKCFMRKLLTGRKRETWGEVTKTEPHSVFIHQQQRS